MRRPQGEWGFFLSEMLVVAGIAAMLLAAVSLLLLAAQRGFSQGSLVLDLQDETRRASDRMLTELRTATPGSTQIGQGGGSVTFRVPFDRDGNGSVLNATGQLELSDPIRYRLGGADGDQIIRDRLGPAGLGAETEPVASGLTGLIFSSPTNPPSTIAVSFEVQRRDDQGRLFRLANQLQITLRNEPAGGVILPPPQPPPRPRVDNPPPTPPPPRQAPRPRPPSQPRQPAPPRDIPIL